MGLGLISLRSFTSEDEDEVEDLVNLLGKLLFGEAMKIPFNLKDLHIERDQLLVYVDIKEGRVGF